MSNSTQPTSNRALDLTTFLSDNKNAQEALDAAKNLLGEMRDYGFVRIYTLPTFEELIAASQIQQTLENNDVKALVDIYPLSSPPEESPIITVGFKIGKKRVPVLELSPGTPLVEENRVSFWVPNSGISSIAVKVLEELFVVRDELKVYSLIAAYISEKNDIGSGIEGLIVEDLEIAEILEKTITFSFYKWKTLPLAYSVAYTMIPYFYGLSTAPEKVIKFLRSKDLDIDESVTLTDLMTEENKLIDTIKSLLEYLNNISKRKRDIKELIYEGVELKEEVVKEKNLPQLLVHGFKQGSYIFLGVQDISLYHVVSLTSLGKHYYRAEDLYLKNLQVASRELPTALLSPKNYVVSGRKGTLLFLTELPPAPTLTYRIVKDIGIVTDVAHIVGFNAEGKTVVPLDSIKRASLDVPGIIRKALGKGWRIDGGSLVKEDEGREFKELLSA